MGNGNSNNSDAVDGDENFTSGNNLNKELYDTVINQKVGYRVLGVQSQSPASFSGLVAFFDFIVAANGIPLKTLDTTFIGIIKESEEKPLTLTVYNYKNHSLREVIIVPNRKWPGEGMLGATIRFDSFHEAEEHIIHVLEVEPNSPAEIASLQPVSDYLLGTVEKSFKDTDVLFQELKSNIDHPIEFYVYNSVHDEVRIVIIMPTDEWGGSGILGASVAQGYLHTLPLTCCKTIGRSVDLNGNRAINSPFGINQQAMDMGGGKVPTMVDELGSGLQQSSVDSSC